MKKEHICKALPIIGIAFSYFAALIVLFHKYSTGAYPSDFVLHIEEAVQHRGYSMAHFLLRLSCSTGRGSVIISFIMAGVTIFTVAAIWLFFKRLLKGENAIYDDWYILFFALCSSVITQIYIPVIYPHFYIHDTTLAQNWHNTTFLFMRLFGWIVLIIYYYLSEHYTEKGNIKLYVLFTISLILANFAKPNFILAFAPAMLVVLVYDFIKNTKKDNWRTYLYIVRFGICVLLSLPIIIVQAGKVYDDGSSIIFRSDEIMALLQNPTNFLLSIISNLAFPLIVTAVMIVVKNCNMRAICQAWLMFAISYLQKLVMAETGIRMNHGNYSWGVYFFCGVLHVVAIGELIALIRKNKISKNVFIVASLPFFLEVISGICYLHTLLQGSYYIV